MRSWGSLPLLQYTGGMADDEHEQKEGNTKLADHLQRGGHCLPQDAQQQVEIAQGGKATLALNC